MAITENRNDLIFHPDPRSVATGRAARLQYRAKELAPFTQTTGVAAGYVQGSPVIIPSVLALDFLTMCQRNPKPCPLIAVSNPGDPSLPTLGHDIDVRTDIGGYRVWRRGELVDEVADIGGLWRNDFVTFVIGCSYSFEDALMRDGLELRHHTENSCVPMYRTSLPLVSSGPFSGNVCVSMRPFRARDAIRAIEITSRFPLTHGTPVHLGDPTEIGITDLAAPLVGDPVTVRPGELPVFWGCGITPQYSLLSARPEIAITHKPGCLLVSDVLSTSDAMDLPAVQSSNVH
ncbi:MAG: putative hydro-lyase [Hyphomicrobiaceae bacterium]